MGNRRDPAPLPDTRAAGTINTAPAAYRAQPRKSCEWSALRYLPIPSAHRMVSIASAIRAAPRTRCDPALSASHVARSRAAIARTAGPKVEAMPAASTTASICTRIQRQAGHLHRHPARVWLGQAFAVDRVDLGKVLVAGEVERGPKNMTPAWARSSGLISSPVSRACPIRPETNASPPLDTVTCENGAGDWNRWRGSVIPDIPVTRATELHTPVDCTPLRTVRQTVEHRWRIRCCPSVLNANDSAGPSLPVLKEAAAAPRWAL